MVIISRIVAFSMTGLHWVDHRLFSSISGDHSLESIQSGTRCVSSKRAVCVLCVGVRVPIRDIIVTLVCGSQGQIQKTQLNEDTSRHSDKTQMHIACAIHNELGIEAH